MEVRNKIEIIVSQFYREYRKAHKSGSTTPAKWFLYEALSFLKEIHEVHPTLNSENVEDVNILEVS